MTLLKTSRHLNFILLVTIAFVVSAEAQILDSAIAQYRTNDLEKSKPIFERALAGMPNDPNCLAWLGEVNRRLGVRDSAIILARKALQVYPCHAFSHNVLADTFNPQFGKWGGENRDSAHYHLFEAIKCDSNDGNAWLSVWIHGALIQDIALMKKANERLIITGFLTSATLAYYRWVLKQLPQNAILIAAGDLDTYSLSAVQDYENLRRDVAVINFPLLNLNAYAFFASNCYNIPFPFDEKTVNQLQHKRGSQGEIETIAEQLVFGWMNMIEQKLLNRPLTFTSFRFDIKNPKAKRHHFLQMPGYYLWHADSTDTKEDFKAIHRAFGDFPLEDMLGPHISEEDRCCLRWNNKDLNMISAARNAFNGAIGAFLAKSYADADFLLNQAERIVVSCHLQDETSERIKVARDLLSTRLKNLDD